MRNEEARRRLMAGVMVDAKQSEEVTEYKYVGTLVTFGNEINKESENNIRM